jgi:hypothetical protein
MRLAPGLVWAQPATLYRWYRWPGNLPPLDVGPNDFIRARPVGEKDDFPITADEDRRPFATKRLQLGPGIVDGGEAASMDKDQRDPQVRLRNNAP